LIKAAALLDMQLPLRRFSSSRAARVILSAATASLLSELAVGECSSDNCETRSWKCDRECLTDGGKEIVFDFRFAHEDGSCEEVIPWNASAMQTDVDLWCLYPDAQYCRVVDEYGWCVDHRPFVGCDNMNEYTFYGLSVLTACNDHNGDGSELLRETCGWVCKHRSPFVRCKLEFDPAGKLAAQNRIDICRVTETCNEANVVETTATCELKPPAQETDNEMPAAAEVTGSLELTVSYPDQVVLTAAENQGNVASSISAAMSSDISGLNAATITVSGIKSKQKSDGRRLIPVSYVQADYSVLTEASAAESVVQMALTAQTKIAAADTSSLASAIRTELATHQIDTNSVVVEAVFVAEELGFPESSESPLSQALTEIHSAYAVQLAQAQEELEATLEELERLNSSSADVLQVLKDKHAAAESDLHAILDAADSLKKELDDAKSHHSNTSAALLNAERNALAAEKRFADAQANLTLTQSELQELEALKDAAEQRFNDAVTAHQTSAHELKESQDAHKNTAMRLADVTSELSDMRRLLYQSQQEHQATLEDLNNLAERSKLRLELELSRHASTQAELKSARAELQEQRDKKEKLAEQLESSRGSEQTFIIVVCVMAFVVLSLVVLLIYIFRRWRKERWTDVQTFVEGDNVVVGRPVQDAEAGEMDVKPASVVRAPTRVMGMKVPANPEKVPSGVSKGETE